MAQDKEIRRSSAIDDWTTWHIGYTLSQRARKRVKEIFGWMKHVPSRAGSLSEAEGAVGGFRRTRYQGLDRTGLAGYLVATALKPGANG